MKCVKAVIAATLLAFMTFYYAAIRPEPEDVDTEPPEEEPTPTPPVYDDSDELTALNERRRAYESREQSEVLAAKREAERTAARSEAVANAAKTKEKAKQQTVSRGGNYVGQAQTFESTFYTANCPTGCTGITASGYDVRSTIYYGDYRVLAAPKSIPLYSILRVTLADGTTFDGIVLDRGGNIGEGRLDILVKTRDEAYRLGRQSVEVRIIRRGR